MVIFEALSLNEPPLNSYRQFAFPFFICEAPKALLLHKGDKKKKIKFKPVFQLSSDHRQDDGLGECLISEICKSDDRALGCV